LRRRLRVFVADDHPSVRENLRYLIDVEEDMGCIGVAKDGQQCLARCLELQPDVLVVDQEIPELDGVSIARALGRYMPSIRVILYTLDNDICSVAQAFGAAACVSKDAPYEWLLSAIRHSASPSTAPSHV
jgi:DNA-binding NarL/FixJ family response regulator